MYLTSLGFKTNVHLGSKAKNLINCIFGFWIFLANTKKIEFKSNLSNSIELAMQNMQNHLDMIKNIIDFLFCLFLFVNKIMFKIFLKYLELKCL